ncbi:MAG: tetratricopeptide repeat protein, partial [Bacteroidetes bacterium]|nr:tetratricopeptide repeat protein [Bacteroidota bacterium]
MPAADAQVEAVLEQRITAHVQAVVERPNDAQAHGLLGNLYAGNGFPHLAMPCYAKAASLDPSNSRWLYYWANLARTTGLAREAEETLRKVIALEPDYAPAHEQLAWLLLDRNAMDEAARIFELVIRLRADNAGGYVGLANIKLSRDENLSAVDLLLRAAEMAPHRADVHYLLGRAYRKLGRLDEAKRELARARGGGEAPVDDPWLAPIGQAGVTHSMRTLRAVDLVNQGRVSEAVPIYEKLLAERPSDILIL